MPMNNGVFETGVKHVYSTTYVDSVDSGRNVRSDALCGRDWFVVPAERAAYWLSNRCKSGARPCAMCARKDVREGVK